MLLFRVFQASEGNRQASEERQTRAMGRAPSPSRASVMQAKIGDVFRQLWKCYHSTFSRLRGISSESLFSINNNFMNMSYKPISLHLLTMNGEKIVNLSAPSIENIPNCYKFELQHSLIRVTQKPYISFLFSVFLLLFKCTKRAGNVHQTLNSLYQTGERTKNGGTREKGRTCKHLFKYLSPPTSRKTVCRVKIAIVKICV